MEPDVVAALRARDVHVQILELLRHLRDEDVAPALDVDGIERCRRLGAQRSTTLLLRTRPEINRFRAQLLELVDEFLWRGGVNADAYRRQLDIAIEMERRGNRSRVLWIDAVDGVEDHRAV